MPDPQDKDKTDAASQGLQHIYWRSRRGMLELELKLVPFVRDEYAQLSVAQQAVYARLLARRGLADIRLAARSRTGVRARHARIDYKDS